MPAKKLSAQVAKQFAQRLSKFRPLPGETEWMHENLLGSLIRRIEPEDFFELFWLDDLLYSQIEIRRLRDMKDIYLKNCFHEGLLQLLKDRVSHAKAQRLVRRFHTEGLKGDLARTLATIGIDLDAIKAAVFAMKLPQIEAFDKEIAKHEQRRNQAISEIQRHRENKQRRAKNEPLDVTPVLLEASTKARP